MIRQTRSRQLVEHILKSTQRPLSMNEVFKQIDRQEPVAFSTVFRIVQRLEARGQIKRVDWRSRAAHYEWVLPGNHHHHLVCLTCNRIVDVSDEALTISFQTIEQTTGFTVADHALELHGYCAECQRKGTPNGARK